MWRREERWVITTPLFKSAGVKGFWNNQTKRSEDGVGCQGVFICFYPIINEKRCNNVCSLGRFNTPPLPKATSIFIICPFSFSSFCFQHHSSSLLSSLKANNVFLVFFMRIYIFGWEINQPLSSYWRWHFFGLSFPHFWWIRLLWVGKVGTSIAGTFSKCPIWSSGNKTVFKIECTLIISRLPAYCGWDVGSKRPVYVPFGRCDWVNFFPYF